jgi:hypothetical protein
MSADAARSSVCHMWREHSCLLRRDTSRRPACFEQGHLHRSLLVLNKSQGQPTSWQAGPTKVAQDDSHGLYAIRRGQYGFGGAK